MTGYIVIAMGTVALSFSYSKNKNNMLFSALRKKERKKGRTGDLC